jgi:circadian clock protein KaiB
VIYRIPIGSWSGSICGREVDMKQKKNAPKRPAVVPDFGPDDDGKRNYVLRLYIAGSTPRSTRAVMNIKEICETSLNSRYDLKVIDIYQQPKLTKGQQIIAAPTLVKELPPPLRKFIGDMSNTDKILIGLDLKPKAKV